MNKKKISKRKRISNEELLQKTTIEFWIFLIVTIFMMFFIIASGENNFKVAFSYDSIEFKNARAEIIKSVRDSKISTTGKGSTANRVYIADILYKFTVGDKTYTSSRFNLAELSVEFSSKQAVDNLLSKYPQGAFIDVFYEHENPSFSVIELKQRYEVIIYFIVSLVVFLFSLLWSFVLFRRARMIRAKLKN